MSEELIFDNFRLGACLATGSTSQIYEAFDQDTNERYAMKLLLDEAFKNSEDKATLKREFKIASGFDHPNLIPVYTHRQTKKYAYFIMEHFGGANLKQIIRGDATVVQARFRKLFECILMGLGHIHEKGWLHRDLKPDNIMMTKATDVRIIDFSLSTRIPGAMTKLLSGKTKAIQGTRTYIAPEIVRRKHPSIASDIYSLGVTVFECLTGRPPFMGSTPNDLLIKHIQEAPPEVSAFNPNVTPEMGKLVLRMLAKRPEFRPTSAAEILGEFRSVKIFHEDPDEFARQKASEEEEKNSFVMEGALDSRADANRRQQKSEDSPETVAANAKPEAAPAAKPAAAKPAVAQAPAPARQNPVPPGQGVPRPAQPPVGHPQAPVMSPQPGGFQQPPQPPYYQGMPQPAWPTGYPMQNPNMPPVPAAPVPQPRQQQPSQQQRPMPPGKGQPTAPQAPPAKPKPQPPSPPPADDLPFADELPDIA